VIDTVFRHTSYRGNKDFLEHRVIATIDPKDFPVVMEPGMSTQTREALDSFVQILPDTSVYFL
jgi:hypothetical protein